MKEEDEILKKCGTENSFTVPEGYFEQFTSDLMSRLPEKDVTTFPNAAKVTMMHRIKPLLYLAAAFVGLMLIVKCMLHLTGGVPSTTVSGSEVMVTEYSDQEIENIVDNSYLDDYAIYELVSEAD